MGRFASDKGGEFTPVPAGTHAARCIRLYDIGTQHGEYQGKPNKRNQVVITWEIPGETIDTDDGPMPMVISAFYTNSLSEKANLRADLEAWRSRKFSTEELAGFDLENILGKPCLLTVVHTDAKKAKVKSVTALPKGMICPAQVNESKVFWIDPWDDNAFAALPDWIKTLIEKSDEWKDLNDKGAQRHDPERAVEDEEDPIPFN